MFLFQFLPSPVAAEIVNIIADYVYECYVRPYPITDESGRINTTVPLRGKVSLLLHDVVLPVER